MWFYACTYWVMEMLRFHKFTIGHAWTTYFYCSDKEEELHWLIKYLSLHNVKKPWVELVGNGIQYPSMMLLIVGHDDLVVSLHSLKFLATLHIFYEIVWHIAHKPIQLLVRLIQKP